MLPSKIVFIGGMHRSGTSWLAGELRARGLDLGGDCNWSGPDNEKGYFEDFRMMEFNDRILEACGGTWWSPPPASSIECMRLDRETNKFTLDVLIGDKGGPVIGVKDPRISLTYPVLREAVKPLPSVFLATRRDRGSVIASMSKVKGLSAETCGALYDDYTARLEEYGAEMVDFPSRDGLDRAARLCDLGEADAGWFDPRLIHFNSNHLVG